MKLTIFGAGYVGLVTGACFAEMGNTVTCVDVDKEKVDGLNNGVVPIYEPGLSAIINHNLAKKRIRFTTEPIDVVKSAQIIFICVGTPPQADGSTDLSYVFETARTIGKYCENHTVVTTKSTVPVGTTEKVREIIGEEIASRSSSAEIDMANNPEFLKEGAAVSDFMGPDRVVIGTCSPRAERIMKRLYRPFLRTDERIIFMSIPSSELTKYASNTMLATRISFMNEIASLAEKVGADIEDIRQGMAKDRRIGKYFLYAGAGYGGSCFPKDISSLIHVGQSNGCEMKVVSAANDVNNQQKRVLADKIIAYFNGDIRGRTFAMWGLAFKPQTDDIREAPALVVADILREHGARLSVHDSQAMDTTRAVLGNDEITYCDNAYDTLERASGLIIMTEWKEYRTPDWEHIRECLIEPVVFDGRNLYDSEDMEELGFRYYAIGHGEAI